MDRRKFLGTSGVLLSGLLLGSGSATAANAEGNATGREAARADFPLMDLHVHRSEELTMEEIAAKALTMKIGVVENIAPWGITCDEELRAYIEAVRPYPVYVGLQPMSPGWTKNLSPELIAQADYVAMDPQIVESGNGYGETVHLWEYTAYIDDAEAFMERNMQHYMDILGGEERLDVFACPLFLPVCIQREYHRLWTRRRLEQVVEAAQARNIAIEINDTAHVPHEEFILMAKRAGLKFTFGSDARNHTVGRLDYCQRVARRCRLTEKDFFLPRRRG